jgi:hypothetical protein
MQSRRPRGTVRTVKARSVKEERSQALGVTFRLAYRTAGRADFGGVVAILQRKRRSPVAKGKRAKAKHHDPAVEMLDQLRRLIMLQLVVSGVKAKDIATVLGVNKSVISGIIPARAISKQKV